MSQAPRLQSEGVISGRMLFQVFNAFNARSDTHSAFRGMFSNRWLWAAVSLSVALHVLVIYVPFLPAAFGTVRLDGWDWARSIAVASSVLWVAETAKFLTMASGARGQEMIVTGQSDSQRAHAAEEAGSSPQASGLNTQRASK